MRPANSLSACWSKGWNPKRDIAVTVNTLLPVSIVLTGVPLGWCRRTEALDVHSASECLPAINIQFVRSSRSSRGE